MNETFVPTLAIGLLHYPMLDGKKEIVVTNITNFDVHDIARAAQVFGIQRYFLIHPIREQLMFVERILDHWRVGQGSKYNPMRKTALGRVRSAESLLKALEDWGVEKPLIIATHARPIEGVKTYSFKELKSVLHDDKKPVFLLFGTGFGMTEDFMQGCDGVLESIRGAPPEDYRHLSVRSAVSICLDRLMGPW